MNIEDCLSASDLRGIAKAKGTPCFVYVQALLEDRANTLLNLSLPYGMTIRYAMKANNHSNVISLFDRLGLHFDASSSYEAQELLDQGVDGGKISLSSQQPPHNLTDLLSSNVQYVATSLHQLEIFMSTENRPNSLGLRVNPGMGAGHNNRLTTGGANSSFGLWNAYIPDALELARIGGVTVNRLHVHIGSGADPSMWGKMMEAALTMVEIMPDVTTLDMGGGYKIHRFGDENEADMQAIGAEFGGQLKSFAERTGRELRLEVEPGSWLVGHAGVLLASIVDVVDTGTDGHTFLKLDTGMNDIARPGMYGSQHRIAVLNDEPEIAEYVVVGHNCETGDILTPASGDPEGLEPRELRRASIGDVVAIYDTGAYCRSMSHKGYNSYPNATEYLT